MTAELSHQAAGRGLPVTAEDGITRAWARHRGPLLPTAEWFWTAAPAGAHDKQGPGFTTAWPAALAGPAQAELFPTPAA